MIRTCSLLLCACLWAGCQVGPSLEACDIRDDSCRQDIVLAVQYVRGTGWDPWIDPPPMRVITKDQYRAEIEASQKPSSQQPDSYDYYTPAYKLFAMFDPDEAMDAATSFTVSFVAAYYDGSTDTITVIDRGGDTNLQADTATLAHELVHAAQQRDIGFQTIYSWSRTIDNGNAVGSLVEGEARLYENLIYAMMNKLTPEDIDWARYHDDWVAGTRKSIAKDASPWRLARSVLRYPLGSRYLTTAWLDGGPLAVRRAWADHPTATRRLMAARGSSIDVPDEELPCAAPETPADFKGIVSTSLGAWAVYAFGTRIASEPEAWDFGTARVADRFTIFAADDKRLAVVWQLQFDSEEHASNFTNALAQLPDKVHVKSGRDGRSVNLYSASDFEAVPEFAWDGCR